MQVQGAGSSPADVGAKRLSRAGAEGKRFSPADVEREGFSPAAWR